MNVIQFFGDPNNVLFTAVLIMIMTIMIMEFVGLIVAGGFSLINAIGNVLPDFDGLESNSFMDKLVSFGKHENVPTSIYGIIFLGIFALTGIIIQYYSVVITAETLNIAFAGIPSVLISFFVSKAVSNPLGEHVFTDVSNAVSTDSLIGKTCSITIGTMTDINSAEVKVRDQYNQYHYLQAKLDRPGVATVGDILEIIAISGSTAKVTVKDK